MGRLKSMPSRLGALPPRVAAMPKVADSFYQSVEWKDYRARHRAWTIQRQGGVWCLICGSTHRLILDHREERKDGDQNSGGQHVCEVLELVVVCVDDY